MSVGRAIINACRSVHLYLTIGGLGLMLFVAFSGFLLNHPDLFASETGSTTAELSFAPRLTSANPPDKLALVESIRQRFTKLGAVDSKEVEIDEAEIRITFRRPGQTVTATLDRKTGAGQLSIEGHGTTGALGDLHRVKNAGAWWGWAMDAAAIVLALSCLTGLVMWLGMKNRRIRGLIALALGSAAILAIYYYTVP